MTSYVENLINQTVQVITNEGRVFIGELVSFDQSMNLVLKNSFEKVYSESAGVKFEKTGLYMIRGDNVAIISEIDENLEKSINYEKIKSKPLSEFIMH